MAVKNGVDIPAASAAKAQRGTAISTIHNLDHDKATYDTTKKASEIKHSPLDNIANYTNKDVPTGIGHQSIPTKVNKKTPAPVSTGGSIPTV